MPSAIQTMKILTSIGDLTYAPMTDDDRKFTPLVGDHEGAYIAFAGLAVAEAICAATGSLVNSDREHDIAIVVFDDRIEIHATEMEGDPVCFALDLMRVI